MRITCSEYGHVKLRRSMLPVLQVVGRWCQSANVDTLDCANRVQVKAVYG